MLGFLLTFGLGIGQFLKILLNKCCSLSDGMQKIWRNGQYWLENYLLFRWWNDNAGRLQIWTHSEWSCDGWTDRYILWGELLKVTRCQGLLILKSINEGILSQYQLPVNIYFLSYVYTINDVAFKWVLREINSGWKKVPSFSVNSPLIFDRGCYWRKYDSESRRIYRHRIDSGISVQVLWPWRSSSRGDPGSVQRRPRDEWRRQHRDDPCYCYRLCRYVFATETRSNQDLLCKGLLILWRKRHRFQMGSYKI